MRRLRLTASTFSILSVEFGDGARARRAKVREERLRGNFPDLLLPPLSDPKFCRPKCLTRRPRSATCDVRLLPWSNRLRNP